MFDTYKAVNQLKEAGFSEQQAVALVKVPRGSNYPGTATRTDIAEVKSAISSLRSEMLRAVAR